MRILNPTQKILTEVFSGKTKSALVISPYISVEGVRMLSEIFVNARSCVSDRLEFWFRLSRDDHAAGLTDYIALRDFFQRVQKVSEKTALQLRCSNRLHAKIYMTNQRALLGSSNLTSKGFGENIEVALLFDKPEELELVSDFIEWIRPLTEPYDLKALDEFCGTLPKFNSRVSVPSVEKDTGSEADLFDRPPHYRLPGLR